MKIEFSADTEFGEFRDALYFEDDAVPDQNTIEAMKKERVDNFVAFIREASNRPPVSKYKKDENGNLILDENGDPIPTGV